ncbi:hypothetical protein [Methylobacterium oryzae]|uniref:Protein of unassigned function n=1 Tax=Methylobacterium oryzae CBMB20 TaxID=693986 RepID=A0A089NMV6_9HYPH|nr:hypothetical protein [Methylobacterium oryzae]AIQ88722.1 protein of unassigned function [Methylobacterium oryzae CBMB20]
MLDTPDHDTEADSLDALLCAALDAAADPVRVAMLTRLIWLDADRDRAADLDAMRHDGPPPVFRL